jgi:putative membrane protein
VLWQWNLDPALLAGIAGVTAIYLVALGPRRDRFPGAAPVGRGRVTAFLAGLVTAALALVSPLHVLGERYLLTAHMVQHLLLTLVVPPLLLLGTPGWLLRPLLRLPYVRPLASFLTSPVVAFLLFNGTFALWHAPALYDLALRVEWVHILEHQSFTLTALLSWWPVLSPLPELPRLSRPAQVLYLFLQSLPPTIIGALITFASAVLYPTYAAAPRLFGLSPLDDQQLAGLIMWVPGALVYLLALSIVFIAWLEGEETGRHPAPGAQS